MTVVDEGMFDHFHITCKVTFSTPTPKFITRTSREWKKHDHDAVRATISESLVFVNVT